MPRMKKALRFNYGGSYEHVPSKDPNMRSERTPRKAPSQHKDPVKTERSFELKPGSKRDGACTFVVLPRNTGFVSMKTRESVWQAVGWARRELNLDPVDVRYFVSMGEACQDPSLQGERFEKTFTHDASLLGCIDTGKDARRIYVNASGEISDARRQRIALHECYHLLQCKNGVPAGEKALEKMESTAHDFDAVACQRLWSLSDSELLDLCIKGGEMS